MKFFNTETISKIRKGYYSAVYFNRTKEILEKEGNMKRVTMQIFQKKVSTLCGIKEVQELLREAAGFWQNNNWISRSTSIVIEALADGEAVYPGETVMHIRGPYIYFAHLESLYLGILARRTLVATNTKKVVSAAEGKPVIFFADRFDYFLNQEGDGFATHIGGAQGVCTQAHGFLWQGSPMGTLPHALISVYNGNTLKACEKFHQYFPDIPLIVLVDFDNDCVRTALSVASKFGRKLWGVRLDTADNLIDASLQKTENPSAMLRAGKKQLPANKKLFGVNPMLLKLDRKSINQEGFEHVKIVVSGGFNEEKIKWFEREKAPVDIYGVGSALVHGENDFTADVVEVEGKATAKIGRSFRENKLMRRLF